MQERIKRSEINVKRQKDGNNIYTDCVKDLSGKNEL
jgi:hypothetical protein